LSYPLHGLTPPAGNRGGEGDFLDSLLAIQALENARALYFSLMGAESDGTLSAPAGGHSHGTANTALHWWEIDSWRLATLLDPSETGARRIVNETSATTIAIIPFILPAGSTLATPRALIRVASASVTLSLTFDFFAPGGLNGAAAVSGGTVTQAGIFSATGGATGAPDWVAGSASDLSGISATGGKRIVWLRVNASVDTGSAEVYQIALTLSDESAAPASVSLDETLALADQTLAADDLAALFVDNPAYLRQLIYGITYPLPPQAQPHNHGEGRGEPIDRHLLSLVYGPHLAEGGGATAGGTVGIPLPEPTSGSFATDPKLVAEQGILVPGQSQNVIFRLATYLPGAGTRTVTIRVEVRPLGEAGLAPGEISGVTGDITFTATGSDNYQEGTVTLDLSTLGDVHRDRVFDLSLWLVTNPPASSAYRLCALLAYNGTAPTTLAELATHQPAEEIPISKILEGQETSTLLTSKLHRVLNQVTLSTLGGVPGLKTDLATVDTDDPWQRTITAEHLHRGTYDDGSGNRVDDGAIIRLPLFAQAYCANVAGGDPEGSTASKAPVLGHKLGDSTAATDVQMFNGRCSIPKGLRAVEIYALIQPGTTSHVSRLIVGAAVVPIGGSDIATAMHAGPFSAVASVEGVFCQVNPIDGAIWQSNAARLSAGLGVWTAAALAPSAELPTGATASGLARWTQPIRVEIAPEDTEDCDLQLRMGVQIDVQTSITASNSYCEDARVLAVLVVPASDVEAAEVTAQSLTVDVGVGGGGGGGGGTPSAHASSHHSGGSDPLSLGSLAGTVGTSQIADGAVTNAKIRDGGACSVIGRSANSSGDVADISASSNRTVLMRINDGLSFVTLAGSSGVQSKWNPWNPPSSIHAMGDEFDDSSLAGKWTTWNPSGSALMTPSEDTWGLKLAGTSTGGTDNWQGIYQPLSSDDEHEFIVRCSLQMVTGAFGAVGIGLLEGTTNTSDLLAAHILVGTSGASTVGINRYTAYNSASAQTLASNNNSTLNSKYFCLQHKLSTNKVSLYWSDDGISWMRSVSDQGTTFTAGYVALLVDCINRDVTGRFEFFRVRSAASGIHNTFPSPLGG
jgi:hypothetical protein